VRVGLKALAVVAVASGLAGCIPSTNEQRVQEYLDRKYGAKYNANGCGADGLFDDQGTIVECDVDDTASGDTFTITVEFDGDGGEVVRVQGMPE
jgi:hypothetical protein